MELKRHWLGDRWYLSGAEGNDANKVGYQSLGVPMEGSKESQTGVPDDRLAYRHRALVEELGLVGDLGRL
jgi:AMP deaminase